MKKLIKSMKHTGEIEEYLLKIKKSKMAKHERAFISNKHLFKSFAIA